jgi:hypothetical protein
LFKYYLFLFIGTFSQHAGAAMALEREVAALREERMRLGDDMKDNGVVKPKRPMSAPPSSPGKARMSWVLSTSPKMRQNVSTEHLSKPVRRKTIEHSTPSQRNGTPPKSSKQKGAAVRMSRGDQAHPHAWEEFMPEVQADAKERKESPKPKSKSKKQVSKNTPESNVSTKDSPNLASKTHAKEKFEKFVKESPAPPPDPTKQKQKMKALASPSTQPREKVRIMFKLWCLCRL